MRLFLLVVLHAVVIVFLSITHPQAEEDEWEINDYGDYVVAAVPGQIIWHEKNYLFILYQCIVFFKP